LGPKIGVKLPDKYLFVNYAKNMCRKYEVEKYEAVRYLKKSVFFTIIKEAIVAKAGLNEIINQIGF
jgi:hypothetical protein